MAEARLYKGALVVPGKYYYKNVKAKYVKGHTLVPWTLQAWRESLDKDITNLPDPLDDYDWPGLFKPMPHQIETTRFMLRYPKGFIWNEPGTGKTASVCWALDYMRRHNMAKRIMIIAPLSTLSSVWAKELFTIIPSAQTYVCEGPARKREKMVKDPNAEILIINPAGVKVVASELAYIFKPDTVIIDEATAYKHATTDQFKTLYKILALANTKHVYELTGTPAPVAPTDLFGQAKLVCPDRIPRTFRAFRDETMVQVSQFRWEPRPNIWKKLYRMIRPTIRFERKDCFELPPITYQEIEVGLSKKQQKALTDIQSRAMAEFEDQGGFISAVHEGALRQKLMQIISGWVYGEEFDEESTPDDSVNDYEWTRHLERFSIDLDPKPRLEALFDIIDNTDTPLLIFAPHRITVSKLYEIASKKYGKQHKFAQVYGGVPLSQRTQIFTAFQSNQIKAIFAQPRTMSHGLTLTAAKDIIWYAPTSDLEQYMQANARIERISQTQKMRVITFTATKFEQMVLTKLKNKDKVQGVLIDYLKNNK